MYVLTKCSSRVLSQILTESKANPTTIKANHQPRCHLLSITIIKTTVAEKLIFDIAIQSRTTDRSMSRTTKQVNRQLKDFSCVFADHFGHFFLSFAFSVNSVPSAFVLLIGIVSNSLSFVLMISWH